VERASAEFALGRTAANKSSLSLARVDRRLADTGSLRNRVNRCAFKTLLHEQVSSDKRDRFGHLQDSTNFDQGAL